MVAAKQPARLLERKLALLRGAWLDACAGRGSAWLLCAEAGGGKTRLAREFARSANADLLWGAAEPVSPPEPYLAISRALPGFEPAAARAASIARAVALLEERAAAAPVLCVLDDLHFADEGTIAMLVRLCALSTERLRRSSRCHAAAARRSSATR